MKKTISLLSAIILFFSCQKELNKPPEQVHTEEPAAIVIPDTAFVCFEQQTPTAWDDNHSGNTTCFWQNLRTNIDTIWQKQYVFEVRHSKSITFTKAHLFIDGIIQKRADIVEDRVIFTLTTPQPIYYNKELWDTDYHYMKVRLIGDGPRGSQYQMKLERAIFLKHPNDTTAIKVTGLPQIGTLVTYK